jgi:two-component system sensor kinase FixL
LNTSDSYKNHLENESRLRAIIDTAIDGIITIDQKGIVETINMAACRIFEYSADEVIGQNISILMPEPDRSRHDGYMGNYQKTGEKKIIGIGREVMGLKKSGITFPFLLSVSEVQLKNKIIYTGIIHDITEVKEAEKAYIKLTTELEVRVQKRTSELFDAIKKLKETNAKQKQAETEVRKALEKEKELNELKSRFVTMASHEFRTPLSTILSSVSLIGKYTESGQIDKAEKHIARIKSAVSNLTGILNDFLSFSKLEEGIVNNHPSTFNLEDLSQEIIDELLPMLNSEQRLTQKYRAGKDVFLDKNIVKNILLNLVTNAIKYSHKEDIVIDISENETHLCIQVIDHGMGIPQEEQQFIFTRFFRAKNAETIQGTGLGLNIVKRYVDLLGGTIRMESEFEVGTTFTLEIPKKGTI